MHLYNIIEFKKIKIIIYILKYLKYIYIIYEAYIIRVHTLFYTKYVRIYMIPSMYVVYAHTLYYLKIKKICTHTNSCIHSLCFLQVTTANVALLISTWPSTPKHNIWVFPVLNSALSD